MPVLISSCIILHDDLLKPWSYHLVEEQWTFSTVFDKIMRGELSSSESEAYAVDIDQTEHRLVSYETIFYPPPHQLSGTKCMCLNSKQL